MEILLKCILLVLRKLVVWDPLESPGIPGDPLGSPGVPGVPKGPLLVREVAPIRSLFHPRALHFLRVDPIKAGIL